MLLIGAAIWTALVQKTQGINTFPVSHPSVGGTHPLLFPDALDYHGWQVFAVPLGIEVSFGIALWLIWAAFVAMVLSITPYFLRRAFFSVFCCLVLISHIHSCYSYRRRFV